MRTVAPSFSLRSVCLSSFDSLDSERLYSLHLAVTVETLLSRSADIYIYVDWLIVSNTIQQRKNQNSDFVEERSKIVMVFSDVMLQN
jgi:hypothetical protein